MEGFFVLLAIFAICCVLSGPVALIISIVVLNKLKTLYPEHVTKDAGVARLEAKEAKKPQGPAGEVGKSREVPERGLEPVEQEHLFEPTKAPKTEEEKEEIQVPVIEHITAVAKPGTLEQRIGTHWVLIAGVVTVIVGVGFFLKYAYDNDLIGPFGRVVIAAVAGLVGLAVGEATRRRGYGIVSKGVTALGFAILYAAVFSAYRFYALIDSAPAFILAIVVTVAAMLYAVGLDEVLMAFLSLLGGFLTPVIVSTGENLPMPLFSYVLILGIGATLCAYYRKWRVVNLLAFAGTFALYAGWFEKFFRPALRGAEPVPEQMPVALVWLAVFFLVYLVLPTLHELVRRVKSCETDILLVLGNAAVTFYYLWSTLFARYRLELAFCALGLSLAHLVLMAIVFRRCGEDLNLRLCLLAIGLFFLTIAVPLYLKMYAIAMAWAAEGVVLVLIGLRYRSIWTQIAGAAALLLSLGKLLHQLPMHTGAFVLALNPAFGTWCFVVAALLVCHIIYRRSSELPEGMRELIVQVLYAATVILLMVAAASEWYSHCEYNVAQGAIGDSYFIRGLILIFAVSTLLFVARPVCPTGMLCRALAGILAGAGSIFTIVRFLDIYTDRFVIFANVNFTIVVLFVATLFAAGWLFRSKRQEYGYSREFSIAFVLAGIFVLWILLTEEIHLYWYCRNRFAEGVANWKFLANMYISVMWALYGATLIVVGFWRKMGLLRYIAIGLFGLLLAKVFILDTATVKSVYRIAAFLATGVTLVGVSYLYQFLKNRGFFEAILAKNGTDKQLRGSR